MNIFINIITTPTFSLLPEATVIFPSIITKKLHNVSEEQLLWILIALLIIYFLLQLQPSLKETNTKLLKITKTLFHRSLLKVFPGD